MAVPVLPGSTLTAKEVFSSAAASVRGDVPSEGPNKASSEGYDDSGQSENDDDSDYYATCSVSDTKAEGVGALDEGMAETSSMWSAHFGLADIGHAVGG